MLRRALRKLLRLVARWLLRVVPIDDPWERLDYAPAPHAFGPGARRTFDWNFEGESAVDATSLDDILLGYDATLIVGRCVPPVRDRSRHAWVVFRRDGEQYLFEPGLGTHLHSVRPLDNVRANYIPEFGVGADRKAFAFAGYIYFLENPNLGLARADDEYRSAAR